MAIIKEYPSLLSIAFSFPSMKGNKRFWGACWIQLAISDLDHKNVVSRGEVKAPKDTRETEQNHHQTRHLFLKSWPLLRSLPPFGL